MRKLVIAMAICLMLALFMGAQTTSLLSAPTMSTPSSLFDLSKEKAMLKSIEYNLATGNMGNIAAEQQMMNQNAKMTADKIYANTTTDLNSRMNQPDRHGQGAQVHDHEAHLRTCRARL